MNQQTTLTCIDIFSLYEYNFNKTTFLSLFVSCRQMVEVNEIDYETAVAPMDEMLEHKDMYDTDSMNSSGGAGGTGPAGYKMGGSTQALVSSSSAKGKKGAMAGSNLSFVDSPMNSLYSSNNSQVILYSYSRFFSFYYYVLMNAMIGVLGHDSAVYGYTGPGTNSA